MVDVCKFSDLRYFEVHENGNDDPQWFTTQYYTVVFNGWRGFFDEELHSQATTWGRDLYEGKHGYWCHGCVHEFTHFERAQFHLDEDPDENPDPLSWLGIGH